MLHALVVFTVASESFDQDMTTVYIDYKEQHRSVGPGELRM